MFFYIRWIFFFSNLVIPRIKKKILLALSRKKVHNIIYKMMYCNAQSTVGNFFPTWMTLHHATVGHKTNL